MCEVADVGAGAVCDWAVPPEAQRALRVSIARVVERRSQLEDGALRWLLLIVKICLQESATL